MNIAAVAVARELAGFIWDVSKLAMSLATPQELRAAYGPPAERRQRNDERIEFPEGGVARYQSNPRPRLATAAADLRTKKAAGSQDGSL